MATRVYKKDIESQKRLERKNLRDKKKTLDKKTEDSFVNYNLQLGMGADNQISSGTYGFNPITRYRVLLEWIHRSSWLGGIAIDVAAEDMIRGGIEVHSTLPVDDIGKLQSDLVHNGIWDRLTYAIKMGRLYGGAIAVLLIDGQDLATPLDIHTVGKGQFKGLCVFDRWMVTPTLNREGLVEEFGPDLGNPLYYLVNNDSPYLRGRKIHYSRVIRIIGTELPYFQKIIEMQWGLSVLERLYDRLVAFDSATSGIAQYIHRMHIRVMKIDKFRQIMAAGGKLRQGFDRFAQDMRSRMSNEGITFIDAADDFIVHNSNISGGISDALMQLGQQLAGALQMPLVRLFGQSPAGLNSTGESDLRTYYEGILQKQEQTLRIPLTKICHLTARNIGIKLPEEFGFNFRSLWILSDEQKSGVFDRDTRAIVEAFEVGIISQKTALMELRQLGRYTNRWNNITDKDVDEAEDEVINEEFPAEMPIASGERTNTSKKFGPRPEPKQIAKPKGNNDARLDKALQSVHRMKKVITDETPVMQLFNLPIVIECSKGQPRWENGPNWPADYGFIASHIGTDGDELDCFIGEDHTANKVFIFNHNDENGDFEELKVMLGYNDLDNAIEHYKTGYDRSPGEIIMEIPLKDFNSWLAHADPLKPIRKKINGHGEKGVDMPRDGMLM